MRRCGEKKFHGSSGFLYLDSRKCMVHCIKAKLPPMVLCVCALADMAGEMKWTSRVID